MGANAPKEKEPAMGNILPFSGSIAPGQELYPVVMEQFSFWQKRCVNKHLFGAISGSQTLICTASATTLGIQLHITHGFLLIRIECLSVDRIDPLETTALIKAALLQHQAAKGELLWVKHEQPGTGGEGKQSDHVP